MAQNNPQTYGDETESIAKCYYDNSLQQLNRHIYINEQGEYEHDISDFILKKGDYFNTFITVHTIGIPNGVTLKLCDENSKPLYSPVDTNNNWITTQCFITVGETDIIQLPAQFNAQLSNHTPFPAGTYNWKLVFNGNEYYNEKELPLTVEIRDFKVWDVLTPQIFPNEDVQVKIKTYADTLYPPSYDLPNILTTHASFDVSTGIITYPNSDLNDLTVGKHMQIINQENKCTIDYEIKNPIQAYIGSESYENNRTSFNYLEDKWFGVYTEVAKTGGFCSYDPHGCADCFESTWRMGYIDGANTHISVGYSTYGSSARYKGTKTLDANHTQKVIIPPGTYFWNVSAKTILCQNEFYHDSKQFTITTEDCSIILEKDQTSSTLTATYLYNNETPIKDATIYIKELNSENIVYTGVTNENGKVSINWSEGRYQAVARDDYTNEDLLYSNIFSIGDPYLNDITISNNNLMTTYGFDAPINEIDINDNGDLILTLNTQTNHINDVYIDENGNLFYRSE